MEVKVVSGLGASKSWLRKTMCFKYRSGDVSLSLKSTVQKFCRRWWPETEI